MSRAHDERKELREGVLSSSGSRVMNPGMPASSLDKEKHEMQSFGKHSSLGYLFCNISSQYFDPCRLLSGMTAS